MKIRIVMCLAVVSMGTAVFAQSKSSNTVRYVNGKLYSYSTPTQCLPIYPMIFTCGCSSNNFPYFPNKHVPSLIIN